MTRLDVPMPKIDARSEIALSAWLKRPGDRVNAGDVIAEASTDKVNVEIHSPVAGTIDAVLVQEGDLVVEGMPIARIVTAP
jgi:pyruvate/2-oxoglutarate dehydrogenase complex dihydrolipoamide acyltransferase (E2) component